MKKEYLKAVNTILFSENEEPQNVNNAIKSMYEIYSKETGIYTENQGDQHLFDSLSGGVVTPVVAANCLKDFKRTTQFLRGIYQAILDKSHDAKLKILYAGSGPYASLLTPFTALFEKEKLAFTLLDISRTSLDTTKRLYKNWGIDDYVVDFVQADATDPGLSFPGKFDIIISETMQSSLRSECQVPLTRNIIRFLEPDGIFIPQEIRIDAYLSEQMDENASNKSKRTLLGNVYKIHAQEIPEKDFSTQLSLPDSDYQYLKLHTEVQVYENSKLSTYDSTLNIPLILDKLIRPKRNMAKIQYLETDRPFFDISYLS